MDWASVVLETLKFIGIAMAAVFGIMGLTTEDSDKTTNRTTRWGKYALAGIIGSAVLTAVTQALELVRKGDEARKSREAVQRAEKTLQQVRRAVAPIHDIGVSVFVDAPEGAPGLLA